MAELTADRLDAEIAHWQGMADRGNHSSPAVRERVLFLLSLCRAHAAAIKEAEHAAMTGVAMPWASRILSILRAKEPGNG